MVTNNIKLFNIDTIALTEECSFVVMKKMSKKLKDPGCFTLLIKIGESDMVHTLSDLGTSINLIPLSVFNILGLGKSRSCFVVLQMTDRTRVVLERITEDVLIKMGKFFTQTNFIMFDYDVDIGYRS